MLTTNKQTSKKQMQILSGTPRVGSHVIYPWGISKMKGIITEDRGNLGVGGKRVFRIETHEPDFDAVLELPVGEFEVID